MRRIAALGALVLACAGERPGPVPTSGADASPPPAAGTVVLENVAPLPLPLWVAFSDGDGPWQRVSGPGPTFTMRPTSPRYGLAVKCLRPTRTVVRITHALVAEVQRLTIDCGEPAQTPFKVSGRVFWAPDTDEMTVVLAIPRQPYIITFDTPVFDLMAPPGPTQISVVTRNALGETLAALLRDVTIDGDTKIELDPRTEALPLMRQALAIPGAAPGPRIEVWLATAKGGLLFLPGGPGEYLAVAPEGLRPGDSQELRVADWDAGSLRTVIARLGRTRPAQVTLPPALTGVTLERLSRPGHDLFKVTFDPQPTAHYYTLEAGNARSSVTAGWLGAARQYTQPDLTAVPGWQASWAPPPGTGVEAQVTANSGNRSFAETWNPGLVSVQDEGFILTIARRDLILQQL
jgi:hypothetical protein